MDKNHPDWVPSLNMGYKPIGQSKTTLARYERLNKRRKIVDQTLNSQERPSKADAPMVCI